MKELMNMRERFTASASAIPKSNPFYEDLPADEDVDYRNLSQEVKDYDNRMVKRNSIPLVQKLKDLSHTLGHPAPLIPQIHKNS